VTEAGARAVVVAAVGYLLLFGLAIGRTDYDTWGVLIALPVAGLVGVLIIRWMFRGPGNQLATILTVGLGVKLLGAAARYFVGFEAYQGAIDAANYHDYAAGRAAAVWSGDLGFTSVIPRDVGTAFTEQFTALVYTLTGPSQMQAFVLYALLAYVGTICFVKAAVIALPDLADRRYAWLCVLAPSLVYWPSSIGKEALMLFGLGVATYGIARVLARDGLLTGLVLAGVGLAFAGLVRPHLAGIWLGGLVPALVVAVVSGRAAGGAGRRDAAANRVLLGGVLAIVGIAVVVVARLTVDYLNPTSDEIGVSAINQILDETTRRTVQANSNFVPPSIASPTDWPMAVLRTLTRPLPHEASGLAQLLSAAEITALLTLMAVSWRRVANLPRLALTNSYVALAVSTLFLGGLAYASFGNLGVLTRQKSLLFPFMLLLACLPVHRPQPKGGSVTDDIAHGVEPAMVPPTGEPSRTLAVVPAAEVPPVSEQMGSPGQETDVAAWASGPRRSPVTASAVVRPGAGPARPGDDTGYDDLWN
jgi:hypothetical protein